MSILSDLEITELALEANMIEPFEPEQVKLSKVGNPLISYGTSSYGYDFRVSGDDIKVFSDINGGIIDPKNFDSNLMVDANIHFSPSGDYFIIPPNSFALATTIERFKIPRDILTQCIGKSTLARCGLILNVTPFEPEWEGVPTIEISNTTKLPAMVYINEGVGQLLFFRADVECQTSYADKKGKYQNQAARVEVARV